MTLVSRARQRAAVAAILAGVSGLSAQTVFAYPQDEQTASLRGKTYAEVDLLGGNETRYTVAAKKQEVTWSIHVVSWLTQEAQTGDNATRASQIAAFETLLDGVEAAVRANYKLLDSQGAGFPVANKFGEDFTTVTGMDTWSGDGSKLEAYVFPKGWVIQQ